MTFNADMSAVVFGEIEKTAKLSAGALLSSVKVQDIYTADGVCALTLRFTFVSDERTLSKQELQPVAEAVSSSLLNVGLARKI